jgi:hypothetical protein
LNHRKRGNVDNVIALIGAVVFFLLVLLVETGREMLRTLKRIEARFTLVNPLEEEQKTLKEDFMTKAHIQDRALHPDIWIHQCVKELRGLSGAEYKEARKMQRYTERTRRN